MKKNNILKISLFIMMIVFSYFYYENDINKYLSTSDTSYNFEEIPIYNGKNYVYINNNEPTFKSEDKNIEEFELYGELDHLGRATSTYALIGIKSMPTEERGNIGMIKPSGWHTIKYDNISGKYLYNRCHLIGYQLTGENANENNLITCTRQMNTGAMLEFENKVANYIKKTNNHVLYRAIPIYEGDNLLSSGVNIEALSIEDNGKGIKFNVFIFNVQDGIEINYKTGESKLIGG